MGSHCKRIILVILTLAFGSFSHSALASLDGTFSGPVKSDVICIAPSFVPQINFPGGTYSLQATPATPPFSTVTLSFSDPALDLSYSGSGTATEITATDFAINVSGTLIVNTGNTSIDGSYSALYTVTAILNPDGSLSLDLGSIPVSGQLPCTTLFAETDPTTLSPTSSSSGENINPEITASSTVTEAILFNFQIQSQVTDISRHITGVISGASYFWRPLVGDNQFTMEGATGLNAGDGSTVPYGVWGNYTYSDFDNDLSSTAFDGDTHSFLGGLDFAFWENTVLGVAFGYDNGDIDTTFNGGNQDTDTYTIAPYFGALLTDNLSLDFNVGYSRVEFDQFRVEPNSTARITSSPDADRWFGALNLNGITYYDNWILGARVGALWAKSVIDSYTESDGTPVAQTRNKLGSGSIAGDVAYSYKNFEPFVNVSYQYDFELTELTVTTGPQPSNDRDDVLMRVGVRYFDKNGISGNLEYSKRFDRDDFDEDTISFTLRADF